MWMRRRARGGAAAAARYRLGRRIGNPTFTETVKLTTINAGTQAGGGSASGVTAGLLQVSMDTVPQYANYQALYNQYCIKSVQFMLLPSYDQYDSANSSAAATPAVTAPRLVYAINDSAKQTPPATELDVLEDNGCKIRLLDRPVKIRCRPVAQTALTDSNSNLQFETRKNRWLSFNVPSTAHSGVAYAISQTVAGTTAMPVVEVYAKITFSLRDPK